MCNSGVSFYRTKFTPSQPDREKQAVAGIVCRKTYRVAFGGHHFTVRTCSRYFVSVAVWANVLLLLLLLLVLVLLQLLRYTLEAAVIMVLSTWYIQPGGYCCSASVTCGVRLRRGSKQPDPLQQTHSQQLSIKQSTNDQATRTVGDHSSPSL